jgi:small conductance mechanosensitive channel
MEWLDILLERLTGMGRDLVRLLPSIVLGALVFALFAVVSRLLARTVTRLGSRLRKHHNVGLVLGRLTRGVVILFGLLVAVTIVVPSFKVGTLVETLGLAGVAIGFAFRDILQNFLAGILILWTEPFRIGDQIVYGTFEGSVEDIQTRATFLRTYDGRRVVLPNSELFTHAVTVNTAFRERRVEYDVGIGFSDDIAQAKDIILTALRELDDVLAEPAPDVLVIELADFAVKLRVRWWIEPPRRSDHLEALDVVLEHIKRQLVERGIDLPYPTTQVLLHDQTEETDGDRRRQREGWPAGPGRVPQPRAAAPRHATAPEPEPEP